MARQVRRRFTALLLLIVAVAVTTVPRATVYAAESASSENGSVRNDLYSVTDTNLLKVSTVDDARTILASSSIWMLQFYHSDSKASQEFATFYKNLAKVCDGIFALAAVDLSTANGPAIAATFQLPTSLLDAVTTTPWMYTLAPSPFDNQKSKPTRVKGWDGVVAPLLESLVREQNTVWTQRSMALGLPPKTQSSTGGTGGGGTGGNTGSSERSSTDGHQRSRRSKPKRSHVIELTNANFDTLVYQTPHVVAVAFTAPWCGHCTNLKPEWDDAAAQLAGEGVVLGWLDATQHDVARTVFGVQGYPTIKIFPGGAPKTATMAMDYQGGRTALSIVQHLLQEVDRSGAPPDIPQLVSPATFQTCREKICVVATLPHILETGAVGRDKYRTLLATVAKSFRTTFRFVWLEVGAQPDLEASLELTFGAPALVAYSVEKQVYAVMRSAFAEKSITTFLHGISTGRQRTVPLGGGTVPTIITTEPWDGLDGAPIEDELSLEDIMGDEL